MRTGAAVVSLALALWVCEGRAQEAVPSPDPIASEDRANLLIDEGVALRKEGREAEALERFRAAHALVPSPRAIGQMGLAAKSLRLYVEAEGYLSSALAADHPWVEENRGALQLALDLVAKHVAKLIVLSNAAGAELFVNGTSAGKLPLATPVRTLAGAARVELHVPGESPLRSDTTLPAGQTTTLRMDVARAMARPSPPAPPPPEQTVDAAPSYVPWIIATAGVGSLGVGLGTYFGVRTLSLKDERDAICPENEAATCPTEEGIALDQDARAAATGSTVTLVFGAAGLVAASVLLALELTGDDAARQRPRISLTVDGTAGFCAATWSF